MYILDTDHMSALEWGSGAAGQRLLVRFNQLSPGEAVTTIVTFEEQTRGWLTVLAQARKLDEQVEVYVVYCACAPVLVAHALAARSALWR